MRSRAVNIITSSKLPKPNVTAEEIKALQGLAKNKEILCLPPDKGQGVVVMDLSKYTQKVHDMLSDTNTYEELKSDPTSKYKT